MRLLLLRCLISLSIFCSQAAAGGPRGAVDKILFYYAYLAEGILNSGFTIAVGCAGTDPGGRCNFNEFLRFILEKPPAQDITVLRSIIKNKGALEVFEDLDIKKLKNSIDRWPGQGMKDSGILTRNVVVNRVVQGANDYGEAVDLAGDPIGKLKDMTDVRALKIRKNGHLASMVNYDWRSLDFEHHRIPKLQKLLDATGFYRIKTVPSRNTLQMTEHKVLDYAGMVIEYGRNYPGFQQRLDKVLATWEVEGENMDGSNQASTHKRALDKARAAEMKCSCA